MAKQVSDGWTKLVHEPRKNILIYFYPDGHQEELTQDEVHELIHQTEPEQVHSHD